MNAPEAGPPTSIHAVSAPEQTRTQNNFRLAILLALLNLILGILSSLIGDWVKSLLAGQLPIAPLLAITLLLVIAIVAIDKGFPQWRAWLPRRRARTETPPTHPNPQPGHVTASPAAPGEADTSLSTAHNPLQAAAELLTDLLFRPARWRAMIASIDPNLPPDFALVDLRLAAWRSRPMQSMLTSGFLIWPLLIGVLGGLVRLVAADPGETLPARLVSALFGMTVGLAYSLAFSLVGSVAGGIVFGAVLAASYALWPLTYRLGLLGDANLNLSWLVTGLILGIAAAVVGRVSSESKSTLAQVARRLGLTLLLLPLTILVILTIVALPLVGITITFMIMGYEDIANIPRINQWLAGVIGVILGLGTAVAVWRRNGRWGLAVIAGLLYGAGYAAISAFLFSPDVITADPVLYELVSITGRGMMYGCLFALCYVFTRRPNDPWVGPLVSSLAGGTVAAMVYLINRTNFTSGVLLSLAGTLIGLSLSAWKRLRLRTSLN